MTWEQICQQYPHTWVLVEALHAYTQGSQRVIPELKLVQTFGADWQRAWEHYKTVHHGDHNREYYVLHTDRPELDIGVLDSFGRVVAVSA